MRPGFHDGVINSERIPTCLELELMAMKDIPPNITPTNVKFLSGVQIARFCS